MGYFYFVIIFFLTSFILTSCGVKGKPLPPEKPTYIGRGKPTYKRAMKDFQKGQDPARHKEKSKSEEEEEDE